MAVAELAHRAQVAGRVDEHAGGALDQRLDDDRRDLLAVGGEHALEVGGVAGLGGVGLEQQRPVGGVEEVDPADRDRAERVAVVGVAQATNEVRRACWPPRCCWYWKAIFSATSAAVEPESE